MCSIARTLLLLLLAVVLFSSSAHSSAHVAAAAVLLPRFSHCLATGAVHHALILTHLPAASSLAAAGETGLVGQ